MEYDNLNIIIPAAGIGKRMKSYGPKSLIELGGGINLLHRQLSILQKLYPKADIVIVSGFESEKIEKFIHNWNNKFRVVSSKEVKVVKNHKYSETNVAKSITMATEFCNKANYLIVYGDLVFNESTFSNIYLHKSGVFLDTNRQMDKMEVGVSFEFTKINRFSYTSDIKWLQIAYLTETDMEEFNKIVDNPRHSKYFSFEIFNIMLKDGINLQQYYNSKARVIELDYSRDIDTAKKLVKDTL